MKSRRGVTLIEGLVATMILLIGMVGIFQGLVMASTQNASASRRTRASAIAAELAGAVEQYGRVATTSLTSTTAPTGTASPANNNALSSAQVSALMATFPSVSGISYFFPDSTTPGSLPTNALQGFTPAYTLEDDRVFQRMIALYTNADSSMTYVVVSVGWNETGRVKTVTRTTAFYNSTLNQTALEY